jgi:ectoine hydroxylase-related dioxygenase (phytanoyl-CoA dioxygenase family)
MGARCVCIFPQRAIGSVKKVDWHGAVEQSGFAILPGLFSREYLDRLLQEINELAPRRTRAGVRHALGLAPVAKLARQPQMINSAREILGPEAFPFRATLFDKSPTANWLVVWHQDTALPLRARIETPGWGPWSVKDGIHYAHAPTAALSKVLALRVHLDDSSTKNGPLRVLPETHKLGVLTDDSIHEVANRVAPVDCVAAKGAVVAMRPLIIHASSKSHEETPRRILHFEYAAPDSVEPPLQLAIT